MATELIDIAALREDINLENYYRCENNNDSSKNARNLTSVGSISVITGKIRNCFSGVFGGTNKKTGSTFNPGTGAFAISCWFKKNGVPTNNFTPTIMQIGNANRVYMVADKDTGYASLETYDGASTRCSSNLNVCDNNWHHIVVQRTGTTHEIWVDNVLKNTVVGTARNANTTYFEIGNSDITYDQIGQCDIDEVAIFSRVLTPAEILALYENAPVNYLKQPRRTRIPGSITGI